MILLIIYKLQVPPLGFFGIFVCCSESDGILLFLLLFSLVSYGVFGASDFFLFVAGFLFCFVVSWDFFFLRGGTVWFCLGFFWWVFGSVCMWVFLFWGFVLF